jgi:toxin ParE1/3/4
MEVSISKQAEKDLFDIFIYSLNTFGETLANDYLQSLKRFFKTLSDNPNIGKNLINFNLNYKVFFFKEHAIFYKIENNTLKIVRVIHSSMSYLEILKD